MIMFCIECTLIPSANGWRISMPSSRHHMYADVSLSYATLFPLPSMTPCRFIFHTYMQYFSASTVKLNLTRSRYTLDKRSWIKGFRYYWQQQQQQNMLWKMAKTAKIVQLQYIFSHPMPQMPHVNKYTYDIFNGAESMRMCMYDLLTCRIYN